MPTSLTSISSARDVVVTSVKKQTLSAASRRDLFTVEPPEIWQPGDLGSFGESSMASRRKRGPVAFRRRLLAGLALSVFVVV